MLTAEQIAGLTGRELDAAVAENVMGIPQRQVLAADTGLPVTIQDNSDQFADGTHTFDGLTRWAQAQHYSTDIAAAMLVLCKARGEPAVWFNIQPFKDVKYLCVIGRHWRGTGATISEAICRAALRAATAKP